MNETPTSIAPALPRKKPFAKRLAISSLSVLGLVLLLAVILTVASRPPSLIELPLGDGRILQIEGVTYGLNHEIGRDSPLKRLRPWLPNFLERIAGLNRGASHLTLDHPGLVVWVNAIDAVSRTNVDCQKIRVEFVDQHGDLFGELTSSWFGGQSFWRAAHIFQCYPRDQQQLTLQVTTWKEGITSTIKIRNPTPASPATWTGEPLPQSKSAGKMEVRLTSLTLHTNGLGRKSYYETPATYFEPRVELFEDRQPASGWSAPEWFAESPNGNRGQFLGTHQPVLRFVTTTYPQATNQGVTQLIVTLPQTDLSAIITNQYWSITNSYGSNTFVVLGLFLRGTHTFSDGLYERSSPTLNGPRGGAPSGWTWDSRSLTPFNTKNQSHHYTPVPVIYVKWSQGKSGRRDAIDDDSSAPAEQLAIRLRDDRGGSWVAKAERANDDIHPFLIELRADVTNIVPELVLLKPVVAEFMVNPTNPRP